ncbi:uncharacterized protein RJT20DRAFT_123977 [Scheffersomyces xylosifermentans]|uniref:uncharacterized protein n=1 Tax=Scheffersomyces xylosifermentans TaxID=1304137 RepID=UPI00315C83F2
MKSPSNGSGSDSLYSNKATYVSESSIPERPQFGSRTGVGSLPSLPHHMPFQSPLLHARDTDDEQTSENNYVEFDLRNMNKSNSTSDEINMVSERSIDSTRNSFQRSPQRMSPQRVSTSNLSPDIVMTFESDSPARIPNIDEIDTSEIIDSTDKDTTDITNATETTNKDDTIDDNDDFFSPRMSNWKSMKTITDLDYYNDKGELEFSSASKFDALENRAGSRGYTKINTEEQVNKYRALDKKTDFLFRTRNDEKKEREIANYEKADLDYGSDNESEYEDENLDTNETLQSTKNMLTDSQKFAYVGIAKLMTVEMATELAMIHFNTSAKVARTLSGCQKHFSNWTLYIMGKLYEHLEVSEAERKMIENLSVHGLEVSDLALSLKNVGINVNTNNKKGGSDDSRKTSQELSRPDLQSEADFDLRWVIVCDLFLLLLGDGYYDSRSRSLLVRFAKVLDISGLEVLQFERRLIDSLELEAGEKTIENDDEKLNDRTFIDKYVKKNRRRRLAYIGLATLGGSLAIGLSAGLLAPVIGAGLAAGLTTVGITGTSGFLAGVGGGVIITTGGVAVGAKVGSKAGARRTGDVHTFELKPLHNNKRTNLIVTVSGWMNGQLDDVRLPFSTVDPVMGDMFSLLWEPEMLQSMGQTIGILASEALSTSIQQILGATVLTALMSAIQLPMALSKLSYLLDNPWNVSLDRAWKAGKILADTLISGNLGVRPITLVGFSLGARLIYSCLIELARRGGFGLIENVIILGNPIAVKLDQLALARSVVSGRFVNGYSKKDWILGYLFRATGGGLSTVAGLSPIEHVKGIENVDCTDLVVGHMSYRTAIPKIMKRIGWEILSEEFAEIEEPDPEQGERTRKLISEFDEARAKMKREMESQEKPKGWRKWFKPKQRDWWDIYGPDSKGEDGSNRNSEEARNRSRSNTNSGGATEEYDETAGSTTHDSLQISEEGPIFDVQALLEEVNDIENLAAKDEATLEKVRKEVGQTEGHILKTNEEEEEVEEEKESEDKKFGLF